MNTLARIATVCQANQFFTTSSENRNHVLRLLDQAICHHPDLVCLPETFATVNVPGAVSDKSEGLDGPTVDAVALRARRAGCYVVCPMHLRRVRGGEAYYTNSVVLIDRRGEIAGIYDKRRPVTTAADYTVLENGVAIGVDDGVFDLDFGRIATRICFDAEFPEEWQMLARRDVRLVVWSSAYDGGALLNAYACLHQYYIVTAVRTDRSRIVDPCGTTLLESDHLSSAIVRDINLDYALCHYDFNFGIPDRILASYAERVEIRSHTTSCTFLVEPTDPSVTIAALRSEFGFETAAEYIQRHRDAYKACERGRPLSAQAAAHGGRAMYSKD